jgi:hypothetical protein
MNPVFLLASKAKDKPWQRKQHGASLCFEQEADSFRCWQNLPIYA